MVVLLDLAVLLMILQRLGEAKRPGALEPNWTLVLKPKSCSF